MYFTVICLQYVTNIFVLKATAPMKTSNVKKQEIQFSSFDFIQMMLYVHGKKVFYENFISYASYIFIYKTGCFDPFKEYFPKCSSVSNFWIIEDQCRIKFRELTTLGEIDVASKTGDLPRLGMTSPYREAKLNSIGKKICSNKIWDQKEPFRVLNENKKLLNMLLAQSPECLKIAAQHIFLRKENTAAAVRLTSASINCCPSDSTVRKILKICNFQE